MVDFGWFLGFGVVNSVGVNFLEHVRRCRDGCSQGHSAQGRHTLSHARGGRTAVQLQRSVYWGVSLGACELEGRGVMLVAESLGQVGSAGPEPVPVHCMLEWGEFREMRQAPRESQTQDARSMPRWPCAAAALGQQRRSSGAGGETEAGRITVKESAEVSALGWLDVTRTDIEIPGTVLGGVWGSWARPCWCGAESRAAHGGVGRGGGLDCELELAWDPALPLLADALGYSDVSIMGDGESP